MIIGNKSVAGNFDEFEKHLPSLFLDRPFDNQIIKAEVRPLKKDKGYFTVILNDVFLAHIHSVQGKWLDFLGKTDEIYQIIVRKIEQRKE